MPEARLERTRKAYQSPRMFSDELQGWVDSLDKIDCKPGELTTIYNVDGTLQIDVPIGFTGDVIWPDRTERYVNGAVVK